MSDERFKKPTVNEVREYLSEINCFNVNPDQFVDFYESKGWVVGRSPMKSWKAAVRTWMRSDSRKNTTYRSGIPL